MNTTSGKALKNGRLKAKLTAIAAGLRMNITDRTLLKYEKDEIKIKDPTVFVEAMKLYNDISIGLAYLDDDPVFAFLFGSIQLTDTLRAATKYVAESDDNGKINVRVLNWGLKDGQEPLSDIIIRKLRDTMHSVINLYFNIKQRQGMAH
jgi:hypothetical protein